MFKSKFSLSLQMFAAAIAQSVSKANEMLEIDHKIAMQRFRNDQFGAVMPPPPPLMIQNVKVKFKGNISRNEQGRETGELFIDLNKPDGNFSAEMEFMPFPHEILKAVKHDGGKNIPFAAEPAPPADTPLPAPEIPRIPEAGPDGPGAHRPESAPSSLPEDRYDTSDTPRGYHLDI